MFLSFSLSLFFSLSFSPSFFSKILSKFFLQALWTSISFTFFSSSLFFLFLFFSFFKHFPVTHVNLLWLCLHPLPWRNSDYLCSHSRSIHCFHTFHYTFSLHQHAGLRATQLSLLHITLLSHGIAMNQRGVIVTRPIPVWKDITGFDPTGRTSFFSAPWLHQLSTFHYKYLIVLLSLSLSHSLSLYLSCPPLCSVFFCCADSNGALEYHFSLC